MDFIEAICAELSKRGDMFTLDQVRAAARYAMDDYPLTNGGGISGAGKTAPALATFKDPRQFGNSVVTNAAYVAEQQQKTSDMRTALDDLAQGDVTEHEGAAV